LCRDCGFRFSDVKDPQKARKAIERVGTIDTKEVKSKDDKIFTLPNMRQGDEKLGWGTTNKRISA
jgi:C4-type Zn-finger protein